MVRIIGILDDVFATKDFAEWRSFLDAAAIIFGIVAKMMDIANDPQMLASEALVPFANGGMVTVKSPIWIKGQEKVKPHRARAVGEHSEAILREAGIFRCRDPDAARRRRDRLNSRKEAGLVSGDRLSTAFSVIGNGTDPSDRRSPAHSSVYTDPPRWSGSADYRGCDW